MSILSNTPRDVSELLSASVELYLQSFSKIIGYSVLAAAMNYGLRLFLLNNMPEALDPNAPVEQQSEAIAAMLPNFLLVALVVGLASSVFYGASLYRIHHLVEGQDDDFTDMMLAAAKKLPSLFFASLLYTLAVIGGIFLLLIPGVILSISLIFCWYYIILEDQGAVDALMSSHRLVWGDWWRTNLVFFAPIALLFVIFFILGAVASVILEPNSEGFQIFSGLLGAVAAPYFYSIVYLQYRDLKLRKA